MGNTKPDLNEELLQAVHSTSCGVTLVDLEMTDAPLVFVNGAFSAMTGYSEEEALGRNCRFLQGEQTDRAAVQQLRECIRLRQSSTTELLNYRKDGTAFWNRLEMSPSQNSRYFVGIQTDITREKKAREREARLRLTLRNFAYTTAHDLKAPLRNIATWLELLEEELSGTSPKVTELIGKLAATGETLATHVGALLRSADADVAERVIGLVSLREAAESSLRVLGFHPDPQGTQVQIGSLPTVIGDRARITQVFQNLIGNAIAHGSQGPGALVTVEATSGTKMCTVVVADDGPGLAPGDRKEILERLRTGRLRALGRGLGLWTCKQVVEEHGGEIWVEDVQPTGARFCFTLPLK